MISLSLFLISDFLSTSYASLKPEIDETLDMVSRKLMSKIMQCLLFFPHFLPFDENGISWLFSFYYLNNNELGDLFSVLRDFYDFRLHRKNRIQLFCK